MTAPASLAGSGIEVDPAALLGLRPLAASARAQRRLRTSALPGPFVTRRRGRGSEVDEVRPWTHGDDMRHIDRNTTARTGRPHVRTFRDERERTVLLVADFRPSMLFGTRRALRSVAAAEALALAGWRAAHEGGRVALLAAGAGEPTYVRASAGERAMVPLLGALARAHRMALETRSADQPDLAVLIETAARALKRPATVLLATALDQPGAGFAAAVADLSARHDLRVALVSDAFERDRPKGLYAFVTVSGLKGLLASGGTSATDAAESRLGLLSRLGVPAVRIDAEAGPERAALALEDLHGR